MESFIYGIRKKSINKDVTDIKCNKGNWFFLLVMIHGVPSTREDVTDNSKYKILIMF